MAAGAPSRVVVDEARGFFAGDGESSLSLSLSLSSWNSPASSSAFTCRTHSGAATRPPRAYVPMTAA